MFLSATTARGMCSCSTPSSSRLEPAFQVAYVRQQVPRLPVTHQSLREVGLLVHAPCRPDVEEGQIPTLTMAQTPHATLLWSVGESMTYAPRGRGTNGRVGKATNEVARTARFRTSRRT